MLRKVRPLTRGTARIARAHAWAQYLWAVLHLCGKTKVAASRAHARNTRQVHYAALVEALHTIVLIVEPHCQRLAWASALANQLRHLEACDARRDT